MKRKPTSIIMMIEFEDLSSRKEKVLTSGWSRVTSNRCRVGPIKVDWKPVKTIKRRKKT